MQITTDGILIAVITAFGGYLLRAIWDQIMKKGQERYDKVAAFDKKEMADFIKATMESSMDYFQKKYNEAVDHLGEVEKEFLALKEQNLAFFKYQLINTCKKYLAQGEVTQYQFDRLSELHKIYKSLGGNSQGDLYYEKALKLPIIREHERLHVNHADDELYVNEEDFMSKHEHSDEDDTNRYTI